MPINTAWTWFGLWLALTEAVRFVERAVEGINEGAAGLFWWGHVLIGAALVAVILWTNRTRLRERWSLLLMPVFLVLSYAPVVVMMIAVAIAGGLGFT